MTTLTNSAQPMDAPAPTVRQAAAKRPRLPAFPNFVLMAHPDRWCVSHGRIIPSLHKLPLQVGVGLVDADGDPTQAIAFKRRRDWIEIPLDVDAPEHPTYVKMYRVIEKGPRDRDYEPQQFCHLSRWERAIVGSNNVAEGGEDYAIWCRSLIDRGVIPDIQLHVLERLLEDAERLHHEYTSKNNPKYTTHVAKTAGDIEVLRAAMQSMNAPMADAMPAPTPKRRRKHVD